MHALLQFYGKETVRLLLFRSLHVHEDESDWRPILGILRHYILPQSIRLMFPRQ